MISIGILTYKRTDLLLSTIRDINDVSHDVELIILNNNEDIDVLDDLNSVITSNNVSLKYIWHKKNYGVSTGRKIITENCDTEYLVLFDDDVSIPNIDDSLDRVIREFDNDDKVYGIAFNIIDHSTGYNNRFEIPHKNKNIDMRSDFDTYIMIGAGHALRVDKAIEAGNYADDFGLYGFEEVDLGFRLVNLGGRIKYLSNCVVRHKRSPDGRFSNSQVSYQAFVNRCIMAKRYFPVRYYIVCLFVRSVFLLKTTKDIKLLFKGLTEIFKDKNKLKFNSYFFNYVNKVKGFLWY